MEVKTESWDCQEKNVPEQPSRRGLDAEVCRDGAVEQMNSRNE